MGQKEFLSRLGFHDNPFQFTNADDEEHLQSYFVPPPFFDSVWGNPDVPQSHVIFAPRGVGKSAQRRMIEYQALENDVFTITYDRFEGLAGVDLANLGTDYHLRNIMRIGLLGFLLEYWTRGMQAPSFSRAEREQIEALCRHYVGKITRLEALSALKSLRTLSSKAKDLLRDWSGPLTALISTALATQGVRYGKFDLGSPQRDESLDAPTKGHIEILRDLIKSIGFRSMYVLIDKVDETPETGNSDEASFLLVKPLLRDLELLQLKGVAFKFFLWGNLEPYHRKYARPDRLQQFELSWNQSDINKMLSRRLAAFSNDRVTNLGQLTEADLAAALQFTVVAFASGSPRDMIRACQEILSEQLQLNPDSEMIGARAILGGISKFSTHRAKELIPPDIFMELLKVGRLDFTTNYIANDVFKIAVNSARNKIRQWMQAGAVNKVGELYLGGRPIYQYAVSDIRIAQAMHPNLNLVEFVNKKVKYCDKCGAMLIRDWDLQHTQSCHLCGAQNTSIRNQGG